MTYSKTISRTVKSVLGQYGFVKKGDLFYLYKPEYQILHFLKIDVIYKRSFTVTIGTNCFADAIQFNRNQNFHYGNRIEDLFPETISFRNETIDVDTPYTDMELEQQLLHILDLLKVHVLPRMMQVQSPSECYDFNDSIKNGNFAPIHRLWQCVQSNQYMKALKFAEEIYEKEDEFLKRLNYSPSYYEAAIENNLLEGNSIIDSVKQKSHMEEIIYAIKAENYKPLLLELDNRICFSKKNCETYFHGRNRYKAGTTQGDD